MKKVLNMWYRSIKLSQKQEDVVKQKLPISLSKDLLKVLYVLNKQNYKPLIVGGAVRDAMLSIMQGNTITYKDVDIEIYGVTYDKLVNILSKFGKTDLVSKSFGVIKFTDEEGNQYDFSIPRRESKVGVGHKGFDTTFDPTITPKEAASRRDFTFNALAYDPITTELHDYFGGRKDLQEGNIKATSPAFMEDSLRVLRGMQFASRFGFSIDDKRPIGNSGMTTADMAKKMGGEYNTLPKERIGEEFMKFATKGKFPGTIIKYLIQTGWIDFFPELKALIGVPQDSKHHPEGDVDEHVEYVLNSAASIADREGLKEDDRAILIFSAMLHDIAKPQTTEKKNVKGKEQWTSYGHHEQAVPIAEKFLQRIGIKPDIIKKVLPLVKYHMEHVVGFSGPQDIKAVRQLAQNIYPASIEELMRLIEADHSGRPPIPPAIPEKAQKMYDIAKQEGITGGKPSLLLSGSEIMPFFNNQSGPHIGEMIKMIQEAYLSGKIHNKQEALILLNKHLRQKQALIKGGDVMDILPQLRGKLLEDAWLDQKEGILTSGNKNMWLLNKKQEFETKI